MSVAWIVATGWSRLTTGQTNVVAAAPSSVPVPQSSAGPGMPATVNPTKPWSCAASRQGGDGDEGDRVDGHSVGLQRVLDARDVGS